MAKYKKIVTKTIEEWLAIRQPRIGGSEISAVIGINPWESRYELYQRKKGLTPGKEENLAMRLGHKLENAVAELLQEDAGYQIIKNTSGNLIYLSEDVPFAEASPDRIAYLPNCKKSEANKCIVEIKTTSKNIDPDDIPAHWICQVQWYMGVTGIKSAVIAWLASGRSWGYQEIPFDAEFFQYLVTEGAEFMRCVEEGIEPDAVTAADVAARYPRHTDGKFNETNEEVALACEEYKKAKEAKKQAEARMDECEDIIKVALADAEGLTYAGLTLATYKASKDSEKFDAKLFQEENPELASKYMKVVHGSRRLNVK